MKDKQEQLSSDEGQVSESFLSAIKPENIAKREAEMKRAEEKLAGWNDPMSDLDLFIVDESIRALGGR